MTETRHKKRELKPTCKHGHPLSGDNLYVNPRGHRECRVCRLQAQKRSRRTRILNADQIRRVIAALHDGKTIRNISRGRFGRNYVPGLKICDGQILKNTRAANRSFAQTFMRLAEKNAFTARSNSARARRCYADPSLLRNDGHDAFEAINAATKHLPDYLRGDVQSAMFIAVGEGRLKLRDAAARVREFVAAHNRQFSAFVPVIGGRMQSLDQQVYDDGPTRLIDTVTQGLWG